MIATALIDGLDGLFESLGDDKDRHIAVRRVFALNNWATLEALGNHLGLSRERIRQREEKLRRRLGLRKRTLPDTLSEEISQFAKQVGQGLPQDEAVQILPASLSGVTPLEEVGVPVLLFLFLAGPYELWDGILLRAQLRTKTESLCQRIWDTLQCKRVLTIEEADQYAKRIGITSPVLVDQALVHVQSEHSHVYSLSGGKYVYEPSAADRAVRALEEHGSPWELEQLAQVCDVSSATLLNAIGRDQRVVRLDRSAYGLRLWGLEQYDGIVGSIHKALDAMDGAGTLGDVADWVIERFNVSWSSVITYATTHHDFITTQSVVRLRKPHEKLNLTDSRGLGEVGDCLEIDGHPALRVLIDGNLWRGSGRPIPRTLARKVGLSPGQKLILGTGRSRISVSWVGNEPALGSLRNVAKENGWPKRGVGFLILEGIELQAKWRPLPPSPSQDAGTMAQAMAALFALPEGSKGHPLGGSFWTALGERLGLQPIHRVPGMVLARLATRREAFVAPYVDALREALLLSEARGLEVTINI